jgi:hypothetical protein
MRQAEQSRKRSRELRIEEGERKMENRKWKPASHLPFAICLLPFALLFPAQMGIMWPNFVPASCSGICLVAHTYCQASACTSATINTSGATLLVAFSCENAAGGLQIPSDAYSNTFTSASPSPYTGNRLACEIFYVPGPATGSSDTFQTNGYD